MVNDDFLLTVKEQQLLELLLSDANEHFGFVDTLLLDVFMNDVY